MGNGGGVGGVGGDPTGMGGEAAAAAAAGEASQGGVGGTVGGGPAGQGRVSQRVLRRRLTQLPAPVPAFQIDPGQVARDVAMYRWNQHQPQQFDYWSTQPSNYTMFNPGSPFNFGGLLGGGK